VRRLTPESSGRRPFDTEPVRTEFAYMSVTLSLGDDVVQKARRRAEAMGTSLNRLIRDYLEQIVGKADPETDIQEFRRLFVPYFRRRFQRMPVQSGRVAPAPMSRLAFFDTKCNPLHGRSLLQ